jgi:hypothetical protein
VIKEGTVALREKGLELNALESFEKNCIMRDTNCLRNYTAIEKSKVKILSINKEVIRKNLGQNLAVIISKKAGHQDYRKIINIRKTLNLDRFNKTIIFSKKEI